MVGCKDHCLCPPRRADWQAVVAARLSPSNLAAVHGSAQSCEAAAQRDAAVHGSAQSCEAAAQRDAAVHGSAQSCEAVAQRDAGGACERAALVASLGSVEVVQQVGDGEKRQE